MKFFGGQDDSDNNSDSDRPMFGASLRDESDSRESKLRRAHEIASGMTMGTLERDEEVWELVRQIKEGETK